MLVSLLLAAFADTTTAHARQASVRELQARLGTATPLGPTGLKGRLLWVLDQFPDPLGAQVASWLYEKLNPQSGFVDYAVPTGRALLLRDAEGLSRMTGVTFTPKAAMARTLDASTVAPTPYLSAVPLFVRWVHARLRDPTPVRLPLRALFATPDRRTVDLDLETAKKIARFRDETATLVFRQDRSSERAFARRKDAWLRAGLAEEWGNLTSFGARFGALFQNMYESWDEFLPVTAEDLLLGAWFYTLSAPLSGLLDWIAAHPAEAERSPLAAALQASARWHRAQAKAARTGAAAPGTVVATLEDGLGTIRELAPKDLAAESQALGHCVGESPVYAKGIVEGEKRILSVWDATGAPVFTIEVGKVWTGHKQTSVWAIFQMKGQKNRIPGLSAGGTRSFLGHATRDKRAWLAEHPKSIARSDLPIGLAVLRALPSIGIQSPEMLFTGDLVVLDLARLGQLP